MNKDPRMLTAHAFQAGAPFHREIFAGQPCFRLLGQPAISVMGIHRSRLTFYALRGEGKDAPLLLKLTLPYHGFHGRTTLHAA